MPHPSTTPAACAPDAAPVAAAVAADPDPDPDAAADPDPDAVVDVALGIFGVLPAEEVVAVEPSPPAPGSAAQPAPAGNLTGDATGLGAASTALCAVTIGPSGLPGSVAAVGTVLVVLVVVDEVLDDVELVAALPSGTDDAAPPELDDALHAVTAATSSTDSSTDRTPGRSTDRTAGSTPDRIAERTPARTPDGMAPGLRSGTLDRAAWAASSRSAIARDRS